MDKIKLSVLAFLGFACSLFAKDLADEVNTLMGATEWRRGGCMVGPCVPHGSIYPSPDSLWPREQPDKAKYPHPPASGYHYGDPVTGFSQLHAQGTSCFPPSYGEFLISPKIGDGMDEASCASPLKIVQSSCYVFVGELERWKVRVRLTPTEHCALYEFTFPEGADARVVLNASRKIASTGLVEGKLEIDREKGAMFGGGRYKGNWNPHSFMAYVYAQFDQKPSDAEITHGREREIGAFKFDTSRENVVRVKVAVSFKSAEQAKKWLAAELPDWNFDAVAAAAKAKWNQSLAAVQVEGLPPKERELFYSHVFHTFVQPRDRTGDFQKYGDGQVWDDQFTLWDSWKTLYPLLTIIDPKMVASVVNSFSTRMEINGECSVCFTGGREFRTGQGGDDVDNVIADAWVKKIPGIDWERAWQVLKKNADRRTQDYRKDGWVQHGEKHDYCHRMHSGSSTIGFAYNDWCAAQVASGLGKPEAKALLERSWNWTNVWDSTFTDPKSGFKGFIRARLKDGSFNPAENPRKNYGRDFYQGNSWEYSFVIPHAIPELIQRMGGPENYAKRLEYVLKNGYADFGNEPSFLTVWLFDFVNRPDLASYWADQLMHKFSPVGPPGDDDQGAMASLYVFMTAGMFPVSGLNLYALHGPRAEKVVFTVPLSGKPFTIVGKNAGGKNIYFKSVKLNGKPLTRPFIRHEDILAGGTLEFDMCSQPEPQTFQK